MNRLAQKRPKQTSGPVFTKVLSLNFTLKLTTDTYKAGHNFLQHLSRTLALSVLDFMTFIMSKISVTYMKL